MRTSIAIAAVLGLILTGCETSHAISHASGVAGAKAPDFSTPERTFDTLLLAIARDDISLVCACFAPREGLDCGKFRDDLPQLKEALARSRFLRADSELTRGKLYFWYTSAKGQDDRGRMVPMPDGTWRIWKL